MPSSDGLINTHYCFVYILEVFSFKSKKFIKLINNGKLNFFFNKSVPTNDVQ